MKLQTIIIAFSALISPLTISAVNFEMYGKYLYCSDCESNYVDSDGAWKYANNTWCKIRDNYCKSLAETCKSVDGYPCCKNSSSKVYYVDYDGEWGVENNNWCFIKSLPLLSDDILIEAVSSLNTMPVAYPDGKIGKSNRAASFRFNVESNFFDYFELEGLLLNGHEISIDDINYSSDKSTFQFSSYYYERASDNDYKIMFREKETDLRYLKKLSSPLQIYQ